jgi:uncharacterized protein DUF4390
MTRHGVWLIAAVLAGGAALPAPSGEIRVTTVVSDGRVLASFTVPSAWTSETRQLVQSGLVLTFSYDVELRRPSSVWFDSTVSRVRVGSAVKFDNLTGTYQLSRIRDGRVVQSEPSKEELQVRQWMTTFDRVPLEVGPGLEPNADYYVRVRLYCTPRRTISLWSMWPFGHDDGSGRADFTFIR